MKTPDEFAAAKEHRHNQTERQAADLAERLVDEIYATAKDRAEGVQACIRESFVIGWLTQCLADAYTTLAHCEDASAKSFISNLKSRYIP